MPTLQTDSRLASTLRKYIKRRYREIKSLNRLRAQLTGFMLARPSSEDSIPTHGLELSSKEAEMVCSGDKILMLADKELGHENENLFLVGDDELFGVIRFEPDATISKSAAIERENEHHTTPSDLESRWPDAKELHAYRLFPVAVFRPPIKFQHEQSPPPAILTDVAKGVGLV